jgi:hypothetical protein
MDTIETWWRKLAQLVAKAMKVHGVKSFQVNANDKGGFNFEVTPNDEQPADEAKQNGELNA